MLPSAVVQLLPTPAVNDMGAGKTPEQRDAWTAKMREAHGNGNGHGPSLEIEARRLLPTPTAQDSAASGGSTPSAVTLTEAVIRTRIGTRPNPRHPNPRHPGATMGPPSVDGPQSWDVPLPLPQSTDDSTPSSSNG